jgi:hypothetical protein
LKTWFESTGCPLGVFNRPGTRWREYGHTGAQPPVLSQNSKDKTDGSIFGHVVNKHCNAKKICLCSIVDAALISTHMKLRAQNIGGE